MASWYWNTRTGWILLIKMVTLIIWWHVDNLVISMKFLFPCKNRSLTSFVLVSLQPWVSLSVVASFDFSGEVCILKLEEALLPSWFSFELELSWDVTITGGNHIIAAQHWSLSNSDLCEAQTYPAQVCISFPCWSRKAPAVVSHLELSGDGLTVLIQILSFAVRHNLYWILLHCTSTKTNKKFSCLFERKREGERKSESKSRREKKCSHLLVAYWAVLRPGLSLLSFMGDRDSVTWAIPNALWGLHDQKWESNPDDRVWNTSILIIRIKAFHCLYF